VINANVNADASFSPVSAGLKIPSDSSTARANFSSAG